MGGPEAKRGVLGVFARLVCLVAGHAVEWRVIRYGPDRQHWQRCTRCGLWKYHYTSTTFEEEP